MPRNRSRAPRKGAQRRGAAAPAASDAAVLHALRLARRELLKYTGDRETKAITAIDSVLEPYDRERKFEVTLTAVVELRTDCPDVRLQIANGFMEYIRDGLHLDPNYLAEVMKFTEIV